jgi:hypothetical protein
VKVIPVNTQAMHISTVDRLLACTVFRVPRLWLIYLTTVCFLAAAPARGAACDKGTGTAS